jgi:8-oxo-dGTP diphosphatase
MFESGANASQGPVAGVAAGFGVSVDVVIFTIRDDALMVLLVRRQGEPFAGQWSLPGGLLGDDEGPECGASRVLREKTGLEGLYLEQLYTFGAPGRDPRGRVVTVGHFALVPWQRLQAVPLTAKRLDWRALGELPELAFDHGDIVAMAHRRLRSKLAYSTIALQLMPERFTLSELQRVYEIILGEPLDKRNFRKRVQAMSCIEATSEFYRAGSHRPARLYRLRQPGRVEFVK